MPYKNFTPTQLTASEVNTYLMNQSVMVFANSAARSASLTLPTEGMVTYLQDTDELEIYNGSAWLRAVVTSDDESISTSGNITSSAGNIAATTGNLTAGGSITVSGQALLNNSGPSGGLRVQNWATNPTTYNEIAQANAGSNDYAMLVGGNNTIVSCATGGTTYVWGPPPVRSAQIALSSSGQVSVLGQMTKSGQPWVQLKGQGANWYQPSGVLGTNTPTGFSWGVVNSQGASSYWNGNNAFVAPYSGIYLCIFKTYQQTYSGTSWIHWLWQVGGALGWNGGTTPYNIYGYSDSAYADGVDVATTMYVAAGNAIQIYGAMGGDERFYSDYTYMSFYFLG